MVGCGAVWRFREIWRVSVLGCAGGAHGQSVAHLAHSGTIGGAGACWQSEDPTALCGATFLEEMARACVNV